MKIAAISNYVSLKKVVKTVCGGCMSECGVLVHVKDGKAVKIEGDPI
jgi:anaerobic selenocysteine-containing dehydrogenase